MLVINQTAVPEHLMAIGTLCKDMFGVPPAWLGQFS